MFRMVIARAGLLSWMLLLAWLSLALAESPRFQTGKYESAELKYVERVPVILLSGTPEEIGKQEAELAGSQAKELLGYAPALIKRAGGEAAWFVHTQVSRKLLENAGEHHRRELAAAEVALKIEGADLLASQTLYDTLPTLGCSSILVPPEASSTQGPLFGRNLDYVTFGFLHRYNLVKVYRPRDKFSFVSVGFPGCLGVLSGMNEHGFCLALHEVRQASDDSPRFNGEGVPTMLALRQLLEECRTVEEAFEKLKGMKRVTSFNLPVCDSQGGGVLEVTSNNVFLRRNPGVMGCTNHFRAEELCVGKECQRYAKIMTPVEGKFDLAAVAAKLHAVNQGRATFQSIIFEPRERVLHVSLHSLPSSAGEMQKIELRPLWK
jgi:hypothetical protein